MDIALLVLLIVPIIAQDDSTCFEQCPENVIGLLNDRFFSALRKVESDGDVCMISGNRIGPYQISEKYYNESVECRPSLKNEGMRWSFVWGNGSRSYSEEVIKSYICREAMMRSTGRQLSNKALAGLHKGGFPLGLGGAHTEFRNAVQQALIKLADGEIPPPRDPEVCDPACALGQCCINGRCHCFNSEEISMMPCPDCETEVSQELKMDLVFIMDASGSISPDNFEAMKRSMQDIVSTLDISGDSSRVAVIVFSTSAELVFNLNRYTDKASLLVGIRNITYVGGGTNTAAALLLLRTTAVTELLGIRSSLDAVQVAVVLTDGNSNDAVATATEANNLKTATDFQVFALGIGSGVGNAELETIASRSDFVLEIKDFSAEEFDRFEREIARQTCLAPRTLSADPSTIDRKLGEGTVEYYRVRIPDEGLTFKIDVRSGRVLICGSVRNQNPDCRDPSSYEWRCETIDYCDIHVRDDDSRKRRQTGSTFMFITVEGVERNNEVILNTTMGDETESNVLSPIPLTDTIIYVGDPLYEVPVTHTPEGMDPITTSLCYQIHGESKHYYSIISDTCVHVNVLYADLIRSQESGNYVKEIGILASNINGGCNKIAVKAKPCVVTVDGVALNGSYNQDGVIVASTEKKTYEVRVPNCKATEGDDLRFRLTCVKVNNRGVVRVDVIRNGGLRPGAHGLLGQFWNIPVDILEYNGNYSKPVNSTYLVTVDHPDHSSPPRSFIAELHPATWDRKRIQCLFAGNAQGGSINEVDVPNDHVIEGIYSDYEVSGLFETDFQYNKFEDDKCA